MESITTDTMKAAAAVQDGDGTADDDKSTQPPSSKPSMGPPSRKVHDVNMSAPHVNTSKSIAQGNCVLERCHTSDGAVPFR